MGIIEFLFFIYLIGHPEIGQRIVIDSKAPPATERTIYIPAQEPLYEDLSTLDKINKERDMAGVLPLKESNSLVISATEKACDIVERDYCTHDFSTFFNKKGYQYKGENLCRGLTESQCFMAWMQSPAHKANMLDPQFNEVGLGKCGNAVVLHFGGY